MGVMNCFEVRRLSERAGGTEDPGREDSVPILEVVRFGLVGAGGLLPEESGGRIGAPVEMGLVSVFARTTLARRKKRTDLMRVAEANVQPLQFAAMIRVL